MMSSVFLYHYLKRNGTRLNGTERTGSESKTTQLCWNINDQFFNQSFFVCMIFNDKHEAIACRILPSDMGQKVSYFWLPCQSIDVLCLSVSLLWTDRTGTERKNR